MISLPTIQLIVTADDLGVSTERNRGIVEAMLDGVVTAASLLVNGPAAVDAIDRFRSIGKVSTIGLHLNFTEGCPISQPCECSTLLNVDKDYGTAAFLGKASFLQACAEGRICPEDVRREALAQILWFRDHVGALPTYVDGHQHAHVEEAIARVLAPLIREHGIQIVRIPLERGYESGCATESTPAPRTLAFCQRCANVQKLAPAAKMLYSAQGLASPDAFVGCSLCSIAGGYDVPDLVRAIDMQINVLCSRPLMDCPELNESNEIKVIEVMCHPGYPADGWDHFSSSTDRIEELRTLCSLFLRDELSARSLVFCSHSESRLFDGERKHDTNSDHAD